MCPLASLTLPAASAATWAAAAASATIASNAAVASSASTAAFAALVALDESAAATTTATAAGDLLRAVLISTLVWAGTITVTWCCTYIRMYITGAHHSRNKYFNMCWQEFVWNHKKYTHVTSITSQTNKHRQRQSILFTNPLPGR